MRADVFVERLDHCKQTGNGKWIARCPAHDDRGPSLSIGEGHDGRILIKCFAGCGAADIVAAVGLTLSDLFPEGSLDHHMRPVLRKSKSREHDELVVEIMKSNIEAGKKISSQDKEAALQAFKRLKYGT